jgi:hypothetical protein
VLIPAGRACPDGGVGDGVLGGLVKLTPVPVGGDFLKSTLGCLSELVFFDMDIFLAFDHVPVLL